MNRKHLAAFLWLRWRLLVNQARRAGPVNAAITGVIAAIGLVVAIVLFVGGVALGAFGMPHIPAAIRLLIWTLLIAVFLFAWLMGLMTAIQRSESLSINKFLHLPVSPSGAFLINYVSSFFSISLIVFVPGMLGLALGEVFSIGPLMLLAFPLLASFIFAMTALTYQFQGWIASLLSNPRRRRTVIVFVTAGIILLVQIPNLINLFKSWEVVDKPRMTPPIAPSKVEAPPDKQPKKKENPPSIIDLDPEKGAGTTTHKQRTTEEKAALTPEESIKRNRMRQQLERDKSDAGEQKFLDRLEAVMRLVCGVLPPGWVAVGAEDLAEGHVLVALLGVCGLTLIGAVSLMRAYRTTVRIYMQGGIGDGETVHTPEPVASETPDARPRFLEWKLPWVSEYAAAVALAAFRSLMRAPEAKMLLLTPFIMLVVFSGALFPLIENTRKTEFGPFVVYGMMGLLMMFMTQLVGNVFGFDRDGFRTFVLSPIPRGDILLGKNLAIAPIVLPIGFLLTTAVGIVLKLRWDQVLASYLQYTTMFLYFCLLGNLCSIYAPFVIPAGSLKGARPDVTVVLAQLGCMLVSPLVLGLPTVLPMGIELFLSEVAGMHGWPISLCLSALILAVSVWVYDRLLTLEGGFLAGREQKILDAVAKRAE